MKKTLTQIKNIIKFKQASKQASNDYARNWEGGAVIY